MKKTNNNSGFSILPALLLVFVVAIAGLVGWRVYDTQKPVKTDTSISTPATNSTSSQQINTKSDLENDQKTLDSSSIDSDLDTTTLSQDIENLL